MNAFYISFLNPSPERSAKAGEGQGVGVNLPGCKARGESHKEAFDKVVRVIEERLEKKGHEQR